MKRKFICNVFKSNENTDDFPLTSIYVLQQIFGGSVGSIRISHQKKNQFILIQGCRRRQFCLFKKNGISSSMNLPRGSFHYNVLQCSTAAGKHRSDLTLLCEVCGLEYLIISVNP